MSISFKYSTNCYVSDIFVPWKKFRSGLYVTVQITSFQYSLLSTHKLKWLGKQIKATYCHYSCHFNKHKKSIHQPITYCMLVLDEICNGVMFGRDSKAIMQISSQLILYFSYLTMYHWKQVFVPGSGIFHSAIVVLYFPTQLMNH